MLFQTNLSPTAFRIRIVNTSDAFDGYESGSRGNWGISQGIRVFLRDCSNCNVSRRCGGIDPCSAGVGTGSISRTPQGTQWRGRLGGQVIVTDHENNPIKASLPVALQEKACHRTSASRRTRRAATARPESAADCAKPGNARSQFLPIGGNGESAGGLAASTQWLKPGRERQ